MIKNKKKKKKIRRRFCSNREKQKEIGFYLFLMVFARLLLFVVLCNEHMLYRCIVY